MDDAVCAAFDKAGYVFPHHAGHGIGLSHPENPYFVRHATETLLVRARSALRRVYQEGEQHAA